MVLRLLFFINLIDGYEKRNKGYHLSNSFCDISDSEI
jgi:hypothetical protein